MNRYKIIIFSAFLLILITISCNLKTRSELIIGKWMQNKKEYISRIHLEFNREKCSLEKRLDNGESIIKRTYNYKLIDKENYLILESIDSTENPRTIRILSLKKETLELEMNSPDSAVLVFHKVKG